MNDVKEMEEKKRGRKNKLYQEKNKEELETCLVEREERTRINMKKKTKAFVIEKQSKTKISKCWKENEKNKMQEYMFLNQMWLSGF